MGPCDSPEKVGRTGEGGCCQVLKAIMISLDVGPHLNLIVEGLHYKTKAKEVLGPLKTRKSAVEKGSAVTSSALGVSRLHVTASVYCKGELLRNHDNRID